MVQEYIEEKNVED